MGTSPAQHRVWDGDGAAGARAWPAAGQEAVAGSGHSQAGLSGVGSQLQ